MCGGEKDIHYTSTLGRIVAVSDDSQAMSRRERGPCTVEERRGMGLGDLIGCVLGLVDEMMNWDGMEDEVPDGWERALSSRWD
jgi:hypothetical protein